MVNNIFTVDFHTHIFPERIAASAIGSLSARSGLKPASDGTASGLLNLMDKTGIDASVLASVATKPEQSHKINLFLDTVKSDKFIPFGAVHPLAGDALDELEFIASLGFKGVKLHPDYQNFYADDRRAFEVCRKCAELGLLVLFHAGVDIGFPSIVHGSPERIARLATALPECRFVCAHFGGWRMWDDVEKLLCPLDNVYIDTSFSSGYIDIEQAKRIVYAATPERILFGSDCPWENPSESLAFVMSLGLTEREERLILGANARRLLGMA